MLGLAAFAGTDPWTLQPGHHDLRVGVEYGGYRTLAERNGETLSVGTPVRAVEVFGIYRVGLIEDLDVELVLPYETVWVQRSAYPICRGDRPEGWCDLSHGVGDISATVRYRLLDETQYRPVSFTALLMAQTGAAYAGQRGRLSRLGDGQTDLGIGFVLGRTGASETGRWYRVFADVGYFYRFGVGQIDGKKAPADELRFGADLQAAPARWFGVGAQIRGFNRLGGIDLFETELGTDNAWVALDALHVQAGPKISLYTDNGWAMYTSFLFTAVAINSPKDLASISFGIGKQVRARRKPGPPGSGE